MFIKHHEFHGSLLRCPYRKANPMPIELVNPDGSKEIVNLKGGEEYAWMEDEEGFTICEEQEEEDDANFDRLLRKKKNKDDSKKKQKPKKKTTYYYCQEDDRGFVVPDKTLPIGKTKPPKGSKRPKGHKPKKQEQEECGEFCKSKEEERSRRRGRHLDETTLRRLRSGELKNLVIPIRFNDHRGRQLPTRSELDTLMNGGGDASLIPTGSVKDVFLDTSDNKLRLESTVVDWVTIDQDETDCAGGYSARTSSFQSCLREALSLATKEIDFGLFDDDNNGHIDAITFLHSGYAAEFGGSDAYGTPLSDRIWSHKWSLYASGGSFASNGVRVTDYHISPAVWGTSGSQIGRIGVIAHETGHFLGLPDLYDYGGGSGIGSWSLMANSWGCKYF